MVGHNHNINMGNKSFKNKAKLRYLERTLTIKIACTIKARTDEIQ
jgi:hypothetical protein